VLTVKLKVMVLVTPPPVAVTVTGEVAAGVAKVVLIVNVEEQLGLQEGEEKEAVAPVGSPEAEKTTTWDVPELSAVVMVVLTACP
jgi:hypothetical protein